MSFNQTAEATGGAPPRPGFQRMTIGEIVTYLFGKQCQGAARESKRRSVNNWIRNGKLRAETTGCRGLYDVEIESLRLRRETLPLDEPNSKSES